MNKKFAEISLAVGGSHYPSINPQLQQRFGEMIVEECLAKIANVPNGYQDYRDQIEDSMRNACIRAIKEHFGVS